MIFPEHIFSTFQETSNTNLFFVSKNEKKIFQIIILLKKKAALGSKNIYSALDLGHQ